MMKIIIYLKQQWVALLGGCVWAGFFASWLMQANRTLNFSLITFWAIVSAVFLALLMAVYLALVRDSLHRLPLSSTVQKTLLGLIYGLMLWPALGIVLMPKILTFGQNLSLQVLGYLSIPLTFTMIHLSSAVYSALLWIGPSWIGLVLLGFGLVMSSRLVGTSRSRSHKALWFFAAGLLVYLAMGLWTTTVYPPTGDEPHYLMISQSLWSDHDLDLRNQMAQHSYRQFYPVRQLDFHHTPTPNGQLISKHFPLLSFLAAPLVALFGRFGAVLMIMASASLIALLLRALTIMWLKDQVAGDWVWLLALVTVPLGIYFDLVFTELPAMAVFLTGLLAFYKGRGRWSWLLLAAACLLPWFYPKYIPLSLVLGILLVVSLRKHPWQLVIMMAPTVLTAAAYTDFLPALLRPDGESKSIWLFSSLFSWRGLGNAWACWWIVILACSLRRP